MSMNFNAASSKGILLQIIINTVRFQDKNTSPESLSKLLIRPDKLIVLKFDQQINMMMRLLDIHVS